MVSARVLGHGFSQDFTVSPGGLTTVTVPNAVVAGTAGAFDGEAREATEALGIHVTSNAEVSVYGPQDLVASSDGFLGLPVDVLGTQYRVLTYPDRLVSEIGVVATVDGTSVTVVPSVALASGSPAGTAVERTLNAGDVLFLPSISNSDSNNDLTGSIITSSQPVAVFAGAGCARIPSASFACNHLVEQLTPTSAWGSDFITAPLGIGDTGRTRPAALRARRVSFSESRSGARRGHRSRAT
jgi:hypothetical protein